MDLADMDLVVLLQLVYIQQMDHRLFGLGMSKLDYDSRFYMLHRIHTHLGMDQHIYYSHKILFVDNLS